MTRRYTKTETDIFIEEVGNGGSASDIAARLSRRYGWLVTRNMVIGKCRRMKISSPTPGASNGKAAQDCTDDMFWLNALKMYELGHSIAAIKRTLASRKTAKAIAEGIATIIRHDIEAEGRDCWGQDRRAA